MTINCIDEIAVEALSSHIVTAINWKIHRNSAMTKKKHQQQLSGKRHSVRSTPYQVGFSFTAKFQGWSLVEWWAGCRLFSL